MTGDDRQVTDGDDAVTDVTDGGQTPSAKWFVRGVPADLTQRITQAARTDGRTVGSVVTDALRLWLDRRETDATDAEPDGWRVQVEARLAALEAALVGDRRPGDATDAPASAAVMPAAVGDRQEPVATGAPGQDVAARAAALRARMREHGESMRQAAAALGIPQSTARWTLTRVPE